MDFAQTLKASKLSVEDLSALFKISQTTITRWLAGDCEPGDTLKAYVLDTLKVLENRGE